MGVALKKSESEYLISLEGVVDIASAAELKEMLFDALTSGKQVLISLAKATYLDVTAVQLLLAVESAAKKSGTRFESIDELPETISESLNEAGFHSFSVPVRVS